MSRIGMGPGGFFHRFHIYGRLPSQSWAEASHSETEPSRCLSHMSELHLCPTPSEFLILSLHHGTRIAVSDPYNFTYIIKTNTNHSAKNPLIKGTTRRSACLNDLMVFVSWRPAIKAERVATAIQAKHVAFAPGGVSVGAADGEEGGGQQWLQPRRNCHYCLLSSRTLKRNSWGGGESGSVWHPWKAFSGNVIKEKCNRRSCFLASIYLRFL